jgi:hypothetical protein
MNLLSFSVILMCASVAPLDGDPEPLQCRAPECFDCCDLTTAQWGPTPCSLTSSCGALLIQNDAVWLPTASTFGWTTQLFVSDPAGCYCKWRAGVCPKPCGYSELIYEAECGSILPPYTAPDCP